MVSKLLKGRGLWSQVSCKSFRMVYSQLHRFVDRGKMTYNSYMYKEHLHITIEKNIAHSIQQLTCAVSPISFKSTAAEAFKATHSVDTFCSDTAVMSIDPAFINIW